MIQPSNSLRWDVASSDISDIVLGKTIGLVLHGPWMSQGWFKYVVFSNNFVFVCLWLEWITMEDVVKFLFQVTDMTLNLSGWKAIFITFPYFKVVQIVLQMLYINSHDSGMYSLACNGISFANSHMVELRPTGI